MPDQLKNAPELPFAGAHIWGWFLELSAGRSSTGFSMSPLGYSEIEAWSRLTGVSIHPWELQAIKRIDRELMMADLGKK